MSFNFAIYKVFISFKDRFMTEGGPSLILHTLKNSDQMHNNCLLKVSNKDTDLIWATCSKLTVLSLEQYQHCSGVFIANCENISWLALVFLLLALNRFCNQAKIHVIVTGKINEIHVIIIIDNYKFLFKW